MKFKDHMNNNCIGFCVVRKANLAKTAAGKPYANLQVYDGSDQIMGRIWDYDGELPKENTVIKIEGKVSEYNGSPQITINKWRAAQTTEYNPEDFMPTYDGDRYSLLQELSIYIDQISNLALKLMVKNVFEDFKQEFFDAPAAISKHHNYLGGLLEHTLSVTKLAVYLADSQKQPINMDLVIAGASLHDIGKIQAYVWEGCAIERSSDGIMIDHIPLGMMMLKPYMHEYLEDELKQQLLHIMVSHHGLKEWGSPVEPITQEAKIVHLADLADARLNSN